jgi:hypothetical protein
MIFILHLSGSQRRLNLDRLEKVVGQARDFMNGFLCDSDGFSKHSLYGIRLS